MTLFSKIGDQKFTKVAIGILAFIGFITLLGLVVSLFVTQVSAGAKVFAQDALGLNTHIQTVESQNKMLAKIVNEKGDEVTRLQKENTKLRTTLDERDSDIADLKGQLAEAIEGSGIGALEERLRQANSELSRAQQTISAKEQLLQNCENEKDDIKNERDEYLSQLQNNPSETTDPRPDTPDTDTPGSQTESALLFEDSFDSEQKAAWSELGSWIPRYGRYTTPETGWQEELAYLTQGATWKDYSFEASVFDGSEAHFGLIVRATGDNDHVFFEYRDGFMEICPIVDGREQSYDCVKKSQNIGNGETKIKLEARGNEVTVFIGNVSVLSLDKSVPPAGYPGLYMRYNTGQTAFDDVKVIQL